MALDAIENVRLAETKAEELTRAAQAEAARIVDEAEAEAIRVANSTTDAARDDAAAKVAAAHEESQKILEQAGRDLQAEMDALTSGARQKQDEAVQAILKALA